MSAVLVDSETLEVLVEAIAASVAIGRVAHSLKSSAGQFGAVTLSAAALAVENAAHAGSAELPQLITALDNCAAATREAFSARLSGLD